MIITLHQKLDDYGWTEIKTLPADDKSWTKNDKSWIDTLLNCGSYVLTVGDTMYELKR